MMAIATCTTPHHKNPTPRWGCRAGTHAKHNKQKAQCSQLKVWVAGLKTKPSGFSEQERLWRLGNPEHSSKINAPLHEIPDFYNHLATQMRSTHVMGKGSKAHGDNFELNKRTLHKTCRAISERGPVKDLAGCFLGSAVSSQVAGIYIDLWLESGSPPNLALENLHAPKRPSKNPTKRYKKIC